MTFTDMTPGDLFAAVRWLRYNETPDVETRHRLERQHSVFPILVQEGDSPPRIFGATTWDYDLGDAVRNIKVHTDWVKEKFPPRPTEAPDPSAAYRTTPQTLRAITYIVERGDDLTDVHQRLLVVTGTTPTDDGFTLHVVRDTAPLPYWLEYAT